MKPVTDVVVIGAGQSGLAAAKALRTHGISPLVLEARARAAGSWPHYYDSLKAFSPAGFSSMPGMPFPGDPDRYPTRDEVAGYLDSYAAALGVEIHTSTPAIRSSGTTTSGSGSMRSSWPPATVPASATSATWAPWTQQAHRCMQAGFRPPTLGLSTSAWNTSAHSPRTPSAESGPMPQPLSPPGGVDPALDSPAIPGLDAFFRGFPPRCAVRQVVAVLPEALPYAPGRRAGGGSKPRCRAARCR